MPCERGRFNESGVDGLIVKKRQGRTAIIRDQQAEDLTELIDPPQQADRTFWTAKAFHSDSATYQAFVDEANTSVSFERTTNILIMDNAAWRRRTSTNWHGRQPKYLPPYSPDLKPTERIRLTMKARWFNNHVCKNVEKLLERLDQAILDVIDHPDRTRKTGAIGKLF